MTHPNPDRWSRIESLPLPSGVGDLDHGLCAVARIAYAVTGQVTDDLACVSQIARRMLIAANDALPNGLRQQLGTVEIRDALLRTTPADDDRLRWVVAEQARQSALRALGYAGVTGPAVDALRACAPIVDDGTSAAAARASAASYAASAADAADADAEHRHRIADIRALLGLETP